MTSFSTRSKSTKQRWLKPRHDYIWLFVSVPKSTGWTARHVRDEISSTLQYEGLDPTVWVIRPRQSRKPRPAARLQK